LRFRDLLVEEQFRAFLADRVYHFVQLSMLASILTYAAFGFWDLTGAAGGLQSMRFRFLVGCPLLTIILALTLTDRARRHWHALTTVFAIAGTYCVYVSVILYDRETAFKIASGNATLNYGLVMVFLVMFPVRFAYTVLIGFVVQLAHGFLLIQSGAFTGMVALYYCFHQLCLFMIVSCVAYGRERLLRREFSYEQSVRDEKDEMKTQLLSFVSLEAIERAKSSGKPVADAFGEVTVVFCDIVDFTRLAERLAPKHLVEVLNDVFSALDQLAVSCNVEKVKTIGDAYMAIAGVADQERNSAEDAAEFALQAQAMTSAMAAGVGHPLAFRIGIHTGSLIGGVVGRQKMAYDYWGKTVNIASRLESTGLPGKIHVSGATYWRLNTRYDLEPRGNIELKGIGPVETYFLLGRKRG
jgi:adenylate cyclase